MTFRFAIVGAGLTGTSMLYQLVARLAESAAVDPRRVHIRLFEKQSVAGPGFPHNERFVQPYHITNMCAQEMGVVYSNQGDFSEWVEGRRSNLVTRFPELREILSDPAYRQHGCSHYPRALMGEYLKARLADAVKLAEELGTAVAVHTSYEVTDIVETAQGVHIQAQTGTSGSSLNFGADRVLLATGHWPRSGSGRGYFASPWPAHRLLAEIPEGAEVAVIGSSLSAIETALTLASDGRFIRAKNGQLSFAPSPSPRRITLMSRHGLLPKVRARSAPYQTRFFNVKHLRELLAGHAGNLTLDAIFDLLDRELERATGQSFDWRGLVSPKGSAMDTLQRGLEHAGHMGFPGSNTAWQSILRQAFPLARDLYLALSITERMRFERDYATLFFAHAATQPPINAEKMLTLMRTGIVKLVKLGHSYQFSEKTSGPGYEFAYGSGKASIKHFRYVVDARGQQRSVRTDTSELTRNLIRSEMIHLNEVQSPGPKSQAGVTAPAANLSAKFASDSVWIDPETHRVLRIGRDGRVGRSNFMYAVGAMTRGQIVDVSMARGLTRSTDRIANDLIVWLEGNQPNDQ